jgi:hypothetical protein
MSSQWMKRWFPNLPGALDRAPMAGLMCAGALLLGVALAGARPTNSAESGAAKSHGDPAVKVADENTEKTALVRENAELAEKAGQFVIDGGRVIFIAADSQSRFIVLENLTLQSVANGIAGNPARQTWAVSGKVTEYQGANYLLLTRVQLQPEILAENPKE